MADKEAIDEILLRIEALRKKTTELASKKGLIDDDVLEASEKLDFELNKYYHLLIHKKENGEK